MFKSIPLIMIFILFIPIILWSQKHVLDNFDSAPAADAWRFFSSENADSSLSFIRITSDSIIVREGRLSLRLDWSVDLCETWGGLSRIEQWMPGDSLLDLSYYDTLSLWYYISEELPENTPAEFRFLLFDGSEYNDGYVPKSADSCEVYYSFHHYSILISGIHI